MTRDATRPGVDEVPLTQSLVFRITAALGIGLVLTAAALLLLFRPYLRTEFRDEARALLDDQALRTREHAKSSAADTVRLVRAASEQAGRAAREVVADTPVELVEGRAADVRELLDQRLAGVSGEAERKVDALEGEIRTRTERWVREDEQSVAARAERRADSFGNAVSRRAAALLLAFLAALFLVHGTLLLRNVVTPVAKLSVATRAVADGHLEIRLPVSGDDEVARLAASFNTMTANLGQARKDLQDANAGLEQRVLDKTRELREALDESRDANRRLQAALEELAAKDRELRRAERMASLGTLAGGVAHEFGNLLGGILGCAEHGQDEDDPQELRETLTMIERTARRGSAITSNLLKFARPGSGASEPIDVAPLLDDVATLIAPEAARRRVEVTVRSDVGQTRIEGDASGLHQVLLNLATNALHALGHDGGRVELAAERLDEGVALVVGDDGPGVPEDVRDRMFEPFFTTRGPEGTGLGLSVSYGIVQAHGGRIDVVDGPLGGAEFRVVLPGLEQGGTS